MLGGSFLVAILRNTVSAGLMLSFFLMLDWPRFSMKKTIWFYIVFGTLLVTAYSMWYLYGNSSFVKYAGISILPVIGIFCGIMSRDVMYLSLYKIALAFYLFSVCTFCGVDVARWGFNGNLWIDIMVRIICSLIILVFTWTRFRKQFLNRVNFLIEEMDLFSSTTLFVSVMLGAIIAYWPNLQGFSIFNMVRAFLILFMAGVLQFTILHLYIHLGQEHYYQEEKELLEVNEQLLHQQMELMRESEKEAARIRHDVRHHTFLIKEYVQKGEFDGLMEYLDQYGSDIENQKVKYICQNRAVNSILSVYARKAESQDIRTELDIRVAEDLEIRDIDWVAILANIFENAIHGCLCSGISENKIKLYITQKGNKVVIQCRNTSNGKVKFRNGIPVSDKGGGIGVSSIIKAASRYDGETDFAIKDNMFITSILLNIHI